MAEAETKSREGGGGVATAEETLTVTDNRTGETYEVEISDGTVKAMDFRQIKVDEDDFQIVAEPTAAEAVSFSPTSRKTHCVGALDPAELTASVSCVGSVVVGRSAAGVATSSSIPRLTTETTDARPSASAIGGSVNTRRVPLGS